MRDRTLCLWRYLSSFLALCAVVCILSGPVAGFQVRSGGRAGGDDEASVTGPYALNGTVVDALTGTPIRRALVQLVGARSWSTLTDEGGKFRFENLPQGQHSVEARKPGYADPAQSNTSATRKMVTIGAGMPPVMLKLEPDSGITVQVLGEDGEGVENLPVGLLSSQILQGRRYWSTHGGGQTDDQGEYRAGNLRPGKYYVSVGPSSRPVGQVGDGANQSDVGYPLVFYPNAADREAAVPVELTPGRRMQVKFSLSTAPLYRISGAVVGGPPGEPCHMQLVDSSDEGIPIGIRADPMTGMFRSGEIPAGFYTLTATYYGVRGLSLVGQVAVRVDSNLTNVTVGVTPAAWIPVNYHIGGGSGEATHDSFPAMVMLVRKGPAVLFQRAWSQPEGKGDDRRTVVRAVMPGTYTADIQVMSREWYVEKARYGPVDLLTDDLTVPEGGTTEAIEITLGTDAARATGSIRGSGGAMAASGSVLFVPARTPRLVKTARIEDGAYTIGGLAPGPYRMIALDRADDLEYTNPEEMRDILAKAQEVTLISKQEAHIDLELLQRER